MNTKLSEQSINLSDDKLVLNDTDKSNDSLLDSLKGLRLKHPNRVVFAHININSIRNKFDMLASACDRNIDVLMISETKLDASFPQNQFIINDYNHYRLDRNSKGGGILVFILEDIPSRKIINVNLTIECMFIEINLRRKKLLLCCSYNPHNNLISPHLEEIS